MGDITSIQLPKETRDKLRRFGVKGQTWAEILENLMEKVEYDEFMATQYARLKDRKSFSSLDEA